MNWRETAYNRKGYMHHTDTPAEDKAFYRQNKEKALELFQLAKSFITRGGVLAHRSSDHGKEEFGTKSRYLHRGVYCPSPALDILIANSKRGRILVRPTERSHITNRYVYGSSERLLFVDNYIDDRLLSTEYLLYQHNTVYGITIGNDGGIVSVSEEQYVNDRIKTYICAYYSEYELGFTCYQMDCEKFYYDSIGLLDWDYYQIHYSLEKIAPSGYIKHNRYRFTRKDGWLISYTQVNIDGTAMCGSCENDIKIRRKA